MATYRNQAERDADMAYQQQRNADITGVSQAQTNAVATTPQPPPGGETAAPAAPVAPAPNQTTATPSPAPMSGTPPWLQSNETGGLDPHMETGVQMGQALPWEGSTTPVTMTRSTTEGLPGVPSGLDTSGFANLNQDFTGAAEDAANQAYAGATQYFNEDFGHDTDALRTQLTNQGFAPGSEGFDRQLALLQRGQDQARTGAALQAQQIGHQQAGDLLMRALQSRQQMAGEQGQNAAMGLAARGMLGGERERDAQRLYDQSLGVAGLGLGARGQSLGRDTALQQNATAAAGMANASNNQRYGIDTQAQLGLRGLGLQQDSIDFQQLMQLINGSRGGVNMPNFGAPQPLDVGTANSIASNNANQQQNRNAVDRGNLAALGGAALGGFFRNTVGP